MELETVDEEPEVQAPVSVSQLRTHHFAHNWQTKTKRSRQHTQADLAMPSTSCQLRTSNYGEFLRDVLHHTPA